MARTVQGLPVPQAVEILVDEARGIGVGGIEGFVSRHIGKAERELAADGPHVLLEQELQRMGSADLVSMGEGIDHHVGAGRIPLSKVVT